MQAIQGADLTGANLGGANLRDADFRGADLTGANLQDANFEGANFRNADLNGADLDGAETWWVADTDALLSPGVEAPPATDFLDEKFRIFEGIRQRARLAIEGLSKELENVFIDSLKVNPREISDVAAQRQQVLRNKLSELHEDS